MTTPQGTIKGTKLAQAHQVFVNRLRNLRNNARVLQNSYQGKNQRTWQVPSDFNGNLLDVANLHKPAFDRQPINDQYEEATNNSANAGTVGDIIALKLQLDYNAAEERAFRARHMSLPRAFAIGHGRRLGQGHGNLWDSRAGVESVIAAYLAAGGVPPAGGTDDAS